MKRLRTLSVLLGAMGLLAGCGGGENGAESLGKVQEKLAPAGSNAQLVSHTVPAAMFPGERRLVTVTMNNNGTASPTNNWTTANPTYALASTAGFGWAYAYPAATVPVGSSNAFSFVIQAPAASASFGARMTAVGLGQFGDQVTVPVAVSAATQPQWGCTFDSASSTLPTTMAPGESRAISLVVRNTGSSAWASTGFGLTQEDNPANFWNQTFQPLTTTVAPGASTTFNITIKAPVTPGTYSFRREMKNTSVGDFRTSGFCIDQNITVGGTALLDDSLVSQDFPTTMAPGETRLVNVTLNNTGTQAWSNNGTFLLYSANNPVNLWGTTFSTLTTSPATGDNATFSFVITAPATPGTYAHRWQMRLTSGVNAGFFGPVISIPVTVSDSATPNLGAMVVAQTIPTLMTAGQFYTFSITMKNSGSTTWSGPSYLLYSTNNPAALWQTTLVALGSAETVEPNANRVFTFSVKAPATAGTYASSWRMRQGGAGGLGFFGATALTSPVTVTLCGNGVVNAGEQCDDSNLTNGDGCSDSCQTEQSQTVYDLATAGTSGRTILGTGAGAQLSPVTIGDITGDGTPEIMVSTLVPVPGTGTDKGNAGAVYGFTGGPSFLNGSSGAPSGYGFAVAGAAGGDVLANVGTTPMLVGQIVGSAVKDLILSAPGAEPDATRSGCGVVYVLAGSSALGTAGLIDLGAATLPSQVTARIIGKSAGDGLVALGVGDVTGDNVPDLVLGAPGDATNGAAAGAIYIIEGASVTGTVDLASPGGAVIHKILGAAAGDQLGIRGSIGDLNGDGKLDLLAGCPASAPGGRQRAGAAFAKFGPITTDVNFAAGGASVTWLGKSSFDGFGIATAIGDVTGTSANEAIIGAIQYLKGAAPVGAVTVWSGVTAGTTYDLSATATPTSIILGKKTNGDCGTAIAVGDFNHDGRKDIAFSCSADDGPAGAKSGGVNVMLGSATLASSIDLAVTSPAAVIWGADAGGFLSRHVPSLSFGDVDTDGTDDLCVGAYLGGGATKGGRVDCVVSPF